MNIHQAGAKIRSAPSGIDWYDTQGSYECYGKADGVVPYHEPMQKWKEEDER